MSDTRNTYTWINGTTPGNKTWRDVCYGNGRFVAVGDYGAACSTNGHDWTLTTSEDAQEPYSVFSCVAYGNGMFLCVAEMTGADRGKTKVFTSPDGAAWTQTKTFDSTWTVYRTAFGGGVFMMANGMTSTDGVAWTPPVTDGMHSGALILDLCYGRGVFTAVTPDRHLYIKSADMTYWQDISTPIGSTYDDTFYSVYYRDGLFLAGGANRLIASCDGVDWRIVQERPGYDFLHLTGEDGYFIARCVHHITGATLFLTSADGYRWQEDPLALPFTTATAAPGKILMMDLEKSWLAARELPVTHTHPAQQVDGLARVGYTGSFSDLVDAPDIYAPDGATTAGHDLTDWDDPHRPTHQIGLVGAFSAKPGQVFQKLTESSFGFGSAPASCANELYADASEGLASLTAKLAALGAPSQSVTVYLTGDWEIPMHKDGAGYAEAKSAVLVPQNVTLDGRYGKLTLTFSDAADPGHTGMTAFRMGQGSALRNFQVYNTGTPQDDYQLLYTSQSYVTVEQCSFHDLTLRHSISEHGYICLYGYKNTFRSNLLNNLSGNNNESFLWGQQETLVEDNQFSGSFHGFLGSPIQTFGIVSCNRFVDLTSAVNSALINCSNGVVTGNLLSNATLRTSFLVTTGNTQITNNHLKDSTITAAAAYNPDCCWIRVAGTNVVISGNLFSMLRMKYGGNVINIRHDNVVISSNQFVLAGDSTETENTETFTAIYALALGTVIIEGNIFEFRFTAQPCLPLAVNGTALIVKNNSTNLNTIGTVTPIDLGDGAQVTVADNILGTIEPQPAA